MQIILDKIISFVNISQSQIWTGYMAWRGFPQKLSLETNLPYIQSNFNDLMDLH